MQSGYQQSGETNSATIYFAKLSPKNYELKSAAVVVIVVVVIAQTVLSSSVRLRRISTLSLSPALHVGVCSY